MTAPQKETIVMMIKDVGFPIVMALALCWYIWSQTQWIQSTLTSTIEKNTAASVEFTEAVKQQTEVLEESAEASVQSAQETKLNREVLEKISQQINGENQ